MKIMRKDEKNIEKREENKREEDGECDKDM